MTTHTLSARPFSITTARARRVGFSWTTLILTVLWLSGVVLAVRGPAPAEPVLLVLFSTALIGVAALLSRYARPRSGAEIVGPDGD